MLHILQSNMGRACCAHTSTSESEVKSQVHLEQWIVLWGSGCKAPCGGICNRAEETSIWYPLRSCSYLRFTCMEHGNQEGCTHVLYACLDYWRCGTSKTSIHEMLRVVSLMGAHGGNVMIIKHQDLFGKSNNIPNKPPLVVHMERNYLREIQ